MPAPTTLEQRTAGRNARLVKRPWAAAGMPFERLWLPLALVFPFAAVWVYFVALDGSESASTVYAGAKALQFALPAAVALWLFTREDRGDAEDRSDEGASTWSTGRALVAGSTSGLLVTFAILATWWLVVRGTPLEAELRPAIGEKMADFGVDRPLPFLGLACFLSFVHSGLEEIYWRWLVFARLWRRRPEWLANVVSSAAFAAHHVVVIGVFLRVAEAPERIGWLIAGSLGVALGGALWAWQYAHSRSLVTPWISHVFADLAILGLGGWWMFA